MNNTQKEEEKPKCESCYDKGYYTQIYNTIGSEDFGGEGFETGSKIHKIPCKECNRVKNITCDCKECVSMNNGSDSIIASTLENGFNLNYIPPADSSGSSIQITPPDFIPPTDSNWEEELKKKFDCHQTGCSYRKKGKWIMIACDMNCYNIIVGFIANQISSTLQQERQREREKMIEEITKKIIDEVDYVQNHSSGNYADGMVDALLKIKRDIIKNKE